MYEFLESTIIKSHALEMPFPSPQERRSRAALLGPLSVLSEAWRFVAGVTREM